MDDEIYEIQANVHMRDNDMFAMYMQKGIIDINLQISLEFSMMRLNDEYDETPIARDIPERALPSWTLDEFMKQTGFMNVRRDERYPEEDFSSCFIADCDSMMKLSEEVRPLVIDVMNRKQFLVGKIAYIRINRQIDQNEMRLIKVKSMVSSEN